MKHGTPSAYNNGCHCQWGCRCETCTTANKEDCRERQGGPTPLSRYDDPARLALLGIGQGRIAYAGRPSRGSVMTALHATPRIHSARAYCLNPGCGFTQSATGPVSDPRIRYAAREHAKATGHCTEVAILDRTKICPEDTP